MSDSDTEPKKNDKKKRLSFINQLKGSWSSSGEGTSPPGSNKPKQTKKDDKVATGKSNSKDGISMRELSPSSETMDQPSFERRTLPIPAKEQISSSPPMSSYSPPPSLAQATCSPPCSEDRYHSLPSWRVLQCLDTTEIANLSGPDDNESLVFYDAPIDNQNVNTLDIQNSDNNTNNNNSNNNSSLLSNNIVACQASSTYPQLPGKSVREGDPICDAFHVKLFSNRALFALADGCAWGFRPREAARRATKAFIHYLEQHQQQIHDVKEAGHFLLRAFDKASREIVVGKDDIWEAGTTTLLGAILLQLELPLEQQLQGVIKTCLVCANVGDCKAFLWSCQTGQLVDITEGNRANLTDAKDPGGRLGPYLDNGLPDLRNLKLYYAECVPGDIVLIVSDGVHDNIDPQSLGIAPSQLLSSTRSPFNNVCSEMLACVPQQVLSFDSWEEAENHYPKLADQAKTIFRQVTLLKLIQEIGNEKHSCSSSSSPANNNNCNNNNGSVVDDSNDVSRLAFAVSPKDITDKLVQYCHQITESSRQWMQQNPTGKLPNDYRAFPGKMDHTTAITFRVSVVAPNFNDNGNTSSCSSPRISTLSS